jgi:uncharacterized protein (UPF0333 family)
MRSGISTTVVVAVIIVIIAVGGVAAYFLSTSGSKNTSTTTTPTTTNVGSPAPKVNPQLQTFLSDFNSRDVSGVVGFYSPTGVTDWKGQTGGTAGNYTGTNEIQLAFATTIGHTTELTAIVSHLAITNTSSTTSHTSYDLNVSGKSQAIGAFNATITVSQNWAYQGGQWQIQNDVWDYTSFSSANPTEATVFPQWGLSLEGKSPTLAGEHMLEWNLAPYLAGIVYASLLAVAAALVLMFARRRKAPAQS